MDPFLMSYPYTCTCSAEIKTSIYVHAPSIGYNDESNGVVNVTLDGAISRVDVAGATMTEHGLLCLKCGAKVPVMAERQR